ncbi:MAG: GAF domain-containing protein [Elusimicrobiota bacterium]
MAQGDHFQILDLIVRDLHLMESQEDLASLALMQTARAISAESGAIFLLNDDGGLFPIACIGTDLESLRRKDFRIGSGIAGLTAQSGRLLTVHDPKNDPEYFNAIDLKSEHDIRSVIAAPIVSRGTTKGVIELVNNFSGRFSPEDCRLATVLGCVLGEAFDKLDLFKELEKSEALNTAIIESLNAGLIVVAPDTTVILANSRASSILSLASIPRSANIHTLLADYATLADTVKRVLLSWEMISRQEISIDLPGASRRIGYSCVPVRAKDKSLLGAALLFQDISKF